MKLLVRAFEVEYKVVIFPGFLLLKVETALRYKLTTLNLDATSTKGLYVTLM